MNCAKHRNGRMIFPQIGIAPIEPCLKMEPMRQPLLNSPFEPAIKLVPDHLGQPISTNHPHPQTCHCQRTQPLEPHSLASVARVRRSGTTPLDGSKTQARTKVLNSYKGSVRVGRWGTFLQTYKHQTPQNIMATFKERLIAGLHAKGWKECSTKSHYAAFQHPEREETLFVGENGALRVGRCASASHSVGDPSRRTNFYTSILVEGDKALSALPARAYKAATLDSLKEFVVSDKTVPTSTMFSQPSAGSALPYGPMED